MSKFFCNGADAECNCPILCADCQSADWTGGVEVKTNADHIRSMSDEEFAMHIVNTTRACGLCPAFESCEIKYPNFSACMNVVANWLKQPYKEV